MGIEQFIYPYSEKELEGQLAQARKAFYLLALFIVCVLVPIAWMLSKSSSRNKKAYDLVRNIEFRCSVKYKNSEGDYPRARKLVFLECNYEYWLSNDEYDRISIGDTAYKSKGCDSVYYLLQTGDTLIIDVNKGKRDAYLETLE